MTNLRTIIYEELEPNAGLDANRLYKRVMEWHRDELATQREQMIEVIGNNDVYLLPPGVKRVYGYSSDEKTRVKAMCITKDLQAITNQSKEQG